MKNWSLKAVVLSISLLILTPMSISSAIADMISFFSETDPTIIKWVITLPSVIMAIFALVYGKLASFISKKTLTLTALIFYIVGGIAPAFLNNIVLILMMRALFGVSIGFLMPLGMGLIADFFKGKELGAMMGFQSAVMNLGNLVFMFAGGMLAAVSWNYTFYIYTAGLFIALWVFLKLPEPPRIEQAVTEKVKISKKVYAIISGIFLINMLYIIILTETAVMVTGEGIGTVAQSATVLTILAAGGLFSGLIFGRVMGLFKKYTVPFGWLSMGFGMITVALSSNLAVISLGAAITGIGMGTAMPCYMTLLSNTAPPSASAKLFANATCLTGIGQFLSPIVLAQIINIFGKDMGRFPILVGSMVLLVTGSIILAHNIFKKNVEEAEVLA